MSKHRRESLDFSEDEYWSFGPDSDEVSNFKDARYVLDGAEGEKIAIYDERVSSKRFVNDSEKYVVEFDGDTVYRARSLEEIGGYLDGIKEMDNVNISSNGSTRAEAEE